MRAWRRLMRNRTTRRVTMVACSPYFALLYFVGGIVFGLSEGLNELCQTWRELW